VEFAAADEANTLSFVNGLNITATAMIAVERKGTFLVELPPPRDQRLHIHSWSARWTSRGQVDQFLFDESAEVERGVLILQDFTRCATLHGTCPPTHCHLREGDGLLTRIGRCVFRQAPTEGRHAGAIVVHSRSMGCVAPNSFLSEGRSCSLRVEALGWNLFIARRTSTPWLRSQGGENDRRCGCPGCHGPAFDEIRALGLRRLFRSSS
jgi:hypothetical protein